MCMRHTHTHRDMEVDIDTYRYLLTAIICLCNILNPITNEQLGMLRCVLSLVATDDLVLKNRPSVSTMLTKYWLFWTSFYTDMLQLKGAILEDKNIFWIKITQFINSLRPLPSLLTHWGPVTHICISKQTIIGSDNGLSPGCRRAIIWTNAGIL